MDLTWRVLIGYRAADADLQQFVTGLGAAHPHLTVVNSATRYSAAVVEVPTQADALDIECRARRHFGAGEGELVVSITPYNAPTVAAAPLDDAERGY